MQDAAPRRTSELLADLADGDDGTLIPFSRLLEGFGRRGFGVLLLAATLPSFLPLPIGAGAISGPLIMLLGLQLLLLRNQPWLPGAIRRRGFRRESFSRFLRRTRPWLERLERICRPRLNGLIVSAGAGLFTGLLLVLNGLLLSLPIPFTNYPFGILMVLFAVALIERDGVLMLVAWLIGLGAVIAAFFLSGEALEALRSLTGWW